MADEYTEKWVIFQAGMKTRFGEIRRNPLVNNNLWQMIRERHCPATPPTLPTPQLVFGQKPVLAGMT